MVKGLFLRIRNKTKIPFTSPAQGNASSSEELSVKKGNGEKEGGLGKGEGEKEGSFK